MQVGVVVPGAGVSWLRVILRAVGLGAAPLGLLGCVIALTGVRALEPVPLGWEAPTEEGLAARAATLRRALGEDYRVRVVAPYVLVSDASAPVVERAASDVADAVRELRLRHLDRSPRHVVDLWLFADARSYRRGARALLGEWPPSSSGYYAPKKHAVVVNAEAGRGAVVHEAVHPIVQASFPDCPLWLDEGLASWLEHREPAGPRALPDDAARARLQRLVDGGRVPSLAALTVSTEGEFYGDPRFLTYTQARHLVLFLRHHDLLSAYLDTLRHDIHRDTTGFATLQRFAQAAELTPLQASWERFTLAL